MNDCLFILDRQPHPAPVDYLGTGDQETKVIAKLDYPDAEANARLIAAAPDLLAALTDLIGDAAIDTNLGRPPFEKLMKAMDLGKTAIAKAEGRAA